MSDENRNPPNAADIAREIRAQEAAEKAAKKAEDNKRAGQGCLIVVGIAVAIAIAFAVWSPSRSSTTPREIITLPNGDTIESSMAAVMCERQVREQLLSPSTAKFPGVFSDRYTRPVRSGNTWRQVVNVDSQNVFGAVLPTSWDCVVDGNSGTIRVTQR